MASYSLYKSTLNTAAMCWFVCCHCFTERAAHADVLCFSLFLFSVREPFSYSDIIIEREVLMQKYIHLVQIVETEKVAANQLRTQLEDQDTEIERLKSEVHTPTHRNKNRLLFFFCNHNPFMLFMAIIFTSVFRPLDRGCLHIIVRMHGASLKPVHFT